MATAFTVIDEGVATHVGAEVRDGRVLLGTADVERATGWVRKPEGLCRDGVCVPVRDPALDVAGRLDLELFARTLQQPIALDVDESAAALGTPAADRGDRLGSLVAPDFTLPDLDGRTHSLSEHRGRKVLLTVYASW